MSFCPCWHCILSRDNFDPSSPSPLNYKYENESKEIFKPIIRKSVIQSLIIGAVLIILIVVLMAIYIYYELHVPLQLFLPLDTPPLSHPFGFCSSKKFRRKTCSTSTEGEDMMVYSAPFRAIHWASVMKVSTPDIQPESKCELLPTPTNRKPIITKTETGEIDCNQNSQIKINETKLKGNRNQEKEKKVKKLDKKTKIQELVNFHLNNEKGSFTKEKFCECVDDYLRLQDIDPENDQKIFMESVTEKISKWSYWNQWKFRQAFCSNKKEIEARLLNYAQKKTN